MYLFCRPTLPVWRCSRWCCCSIRNCCWCHFTSTDTLTNISVLWNEWRHSLCRVHKERCMTCCLAFMIDIVTANIAYNFVKILLSTSAGEHKWSSYFRRAFPSDYPTAFPWQFPPKDFSILGKFWHITKWTYLLSQYNWHHPAKESPVQSSGYISICQGLLSKLSFHCNMGWCSRIRSYWWHVTGKLYMISTMIQSS